MPTFKPSSRRLRLLLVEDNPDTTKLMKMLLESTGHTVITAFNGRKALDVLQTETVDMILLDVMMPEMDGFTFLETVRKSTDAPVLMLTALSDPHAIEEGFLLGADDYLVKPFTPDELFSRLERLTNQLPPPRTLPPRVTAGRFSLDVMTGILKVDNRTIPLSQIETRLMQHLLGSAGRRSAPEELFQAAWGRASNPRDQSVDTVSIAINRLRDKIEEDPTRPRYLINEGTVGYLLNSN